MDRLIRRVLLCAATAILVLASTAHAEDVTFTLRTPEGSSMVVETASLRGTFNGWGETPMERQEDGTWSVTVDLEPGEYEYKFFINSQWPDDMSTWLDGWPVDDEADDYTDDSYGGQNAVRIVGGAAADAEELPPAPPIPEGSARIHYHRPRGRYSDWGLHLWGDTPHQVSWGEPLPQTGRDAYGVFWDVKLTEGAEEVGFIVHKGDAKDPGHDMFLRPSEQGREVWLVSGRSDINTEPPDIEVLALGDLSRARAHWVDRSTIAWRLRVVPTDVYELHSDAGAGLGLATEGVVGGQKLTLKPDPNGLPRVLLARFPHLTGCAALRIADEDVERVPEFLKGQVGVSVLDEEGRLKDATGLQIPGVLDDLFAYEGPLGVTWEADGAPSVYVWAPTAQSVWLHLFDTSSASEPVAVLELTEDNGVWQVRGEADWKWKYYLYEVKVYSPATGRVERTLVTDPYSRSLSMNSARSQFVDMGDPALTPEGWDALAKPPLEAPEDIVLYELHVRDFSAADATVPADYAGTFMAFTVDSDGTRHLRSLAEAGVTHVHLLPAFDIATIDEDRATWRDPGDLSVYPPDSDRQQAAIAGVQGQDGYNWGYDPFHYGVPEGSYSTEPDGPGRILEFRRMVEALSDMGLRVVMDVVYNHTNASGLSEKSVLDKIVPGYYHRLNADGLVETSTCCQNTATEHAMMERVMVDDLVHWATDYKVDGFRFDLMGHHMKRNMEHVRDGLHALTPERDGVDGSRIYIYGEGWDFGEVQGGKRGTNATQMNMAGTGIGTFNDRIRNAVQGGSPFTDRREQGFATGLFYDPNGLGRAGASERAGLLSLTDRIRIGMAGNLRDYTFTDRTGSTIRGGQLEGTGYAADPQEAINYVSAHDNETFFDKIQYAARPDATLGERVGMQNVAVSVVALGQGIPFFHAGVEVLRSKSMDRDSYNSGDWFNKLDWTYASNNFGVGLPVADKNQERWNVIGPLLAREDITPGEGEIRSALDRFREVVSIRRSSPLFRLRTGDDIRARLRYHNTGPDQIPGVIVMSISDEVEGRPDIDPLYERVVVVINATKLTQTVSDSDWQNAAFELHPLQRNSRDDRPACGSFDSPSGVFVVMPRTTAVFVER